MKICAVIAEYNPLHLGHLIHLDYVKNTLEADKIIVVMSGNFTQRGEIAVTDKFKRARQAITAGADMVIELPTVFATANAETFAKGAVGIIDRLGVVDQLCFGVESGSKQEYLDLAYALNDESKEFKRALKDCLNEGNSLAKAKVQAVKQLGKQVNVDLVSSPNNLLGIEYTKALVKLNSNIQIEPMIRSGNHNDKSLKKGVTSASSIRETLKTGKIKKVKGNLPQYSYKDLTGYPRGLDKLVLSALITSDAKKIALCPDCSEGLENRLKALSKDNKDLELLVEKATSKRYTSSRIRRILLANLFNITSEFTTECLNSIPYAKVLAVSPQSKDLLSHVCTNASLPVITRSNDLLGLKKTAEKCYRLDLLANDIYELATDQKVMENHFIVK
ncbi:MAG: nucleotidyltransferase family protein [Clostridia bacterium]|nr:nucleotidyltransferase family protein [Clostridia bacterium]